MPSIMDILLPESYDSDDSSKLLKVNEIIESTDLDSVVNFKVNSKLKAEFDRLCKVEHSTVSRELKRYMTSVIKAQKIS